MSKSQTWLLLIIRILLDVAAILAAFIAAYCIHFRVLPLSPAASLRFIAAYRRLFIIVIPMWLLAFNLAGLYRYDLEPLPRLTGPDRLLRIAGGVTLAVVVTYWVTYIWPEYYLVRQTPRPLILYVWVFGLAFVGLIRLVIGFCARLLDRRTAEATEAKPAQ